MCCRLGTALPGRPWRWPCWRRNGTAVILDTASCELALKDVALAMLGHLGILGEVMINGVDRAKYGNALYGAYGQDFETADGRRWWSA